MAGKPPDRRRRRPRRTNEGFWGWTTKGRPTNWEIHEDTAGAGTDTSTGTAMTQAPAHVVVRSAAHAVPRRRQRRAPSCGARQRRARARRVAATTAAAMTPRGRRNAVDVDRRDCPAAAPPIHALVMPALMSYPIAYSLCECRGMPEATNAGAATAMTRRRGEGRRILPPFLSMSRSQHRGFSAAAATFYEAHLSMPTMTRVNTITTMTRMRTAATSERTEHERRARARARALRTTRTGTRAERSRETTGTLGANPGTGLVGVACAGTGIANGAAPGTVALGPLRPYLV
ncbi:hypothetical protein BJ912DRAFT_934618 [Pholiota molesta]|nr:hypothetical protein BJ912DRAFT_934618 [Pholiota molesta]